MEGLVTDAAARLGGRVHALLSHLVAHRNRVVSTQELLHVVWADADRKPVRLAQYVSKARQHLGDDPRSPRLIRTIYGYGYQYVGPELRLPARAYAPVKAVPAASPHTIAVWPPRS